MERARRSQCVLAAAHLLPRRHRPPAHGTKKLGLILDSSHEAEAIGSAKAGELVSYAREILRTLGELPSDRTTILTDNKANLLVATNSASAQRSRHFLRRYYALRQRMARGECRLVKVDDANMPADFMTKWLGGPKFRHVARVRHQLRRVVT